uniref:Uncharacterized protein n=1 Tax=Plectus sambesii TaxID=2011161 RepID=A0A914WKC4_9BILA
MEVYKTRNSRRSYNNLLFSYMLYYAADDTKTTAGTSFYIPALLAFIRLHTPNYTDNDDSTDYDISNANRHFIERILSSNDDDQDGINDESDCGVDNKAAASSYATRTTTTA